MRKLLLFLATCIVATAGYIGALSMENRLPGYLVAFGAWLIYMIITVYREQRY